MHVEQDGKTLLSTPVVRKIEIVKQVENMTVLEGSSIVAIDFLTGLSIFYKPPIEKVAFNMIVKSQLVRDIMRHQN